MTRHHELIALRVRAERCTKEAKALRVLVSQLEDELAQAKRLPDDHFAELVDLSIALVEWERMPWWRRIWTTPKAMLLLDGAS
jgi:hypothetical protein